MQVKLALVGKKISHSKSPELQKEIWGDELLQYDLIDVDDDKHLPRLEDLAQTYLGINITTPFKEFYFKSVQVDLEIVRAIGAINTIALTDMSATNTDAVAVEKILRRHQLEIPQLRIHLLGAGVMARMTVLIAQELNIELIHYSRQSHGDLTHLDLSHLCERDLVINSCSRSFVFQGEIAPASSFWDYNYSFPPHQYLATIIKSYQDGQELLREQAISAASFWRQKTKINI